MSTTQNLNKPAAQHTNGATLCIMLISGDDQQVLQIKKTLENSIHVPWSILHCTHLKEAEPLINKADVILLDAGGRGTAYAKRFFEAVAGLKHEQPIIVLTGETDSERELALFVMEKGASDVLIRGAFGRISDAIEYAIIRQVIMSRERERSEQVLSNTVDAAAENVKVIEGAADDEKRKQKQLLDMFLGGYSATQ
jgi:FixJ family two-component response regulator